MKVVFRKGLLLNAADIVTLGISHEGDECEPKAFVRDVAIGLRDQASTLSLGLGSPLRLEVAASFRNLAPIVAAIAAWEWGRSCRQLLLRTGGLDFVVGDPARLLRPAQEAGVRIPSALQGLQPLVGRDLYFTSGLQTIVGLPRGRDLLSPVGESIPLLAARGWLAAFFRPQNAYLLAVSEGDLVVGHPDILRLGELKPLAAKAAAPS